jgi:hypothetical protein
MSENEFSVWIFYTDGTHFSEWRYLDGDSAVRKAKELTQRPFVELGICEKIIITDGNDFTAFEWRPGQGVVYPPLGI